MTRCIFITLLLSSFMSFSQVILFVNKDAIINDKTLEEMSYTNDRVHKYYKQIKQQLFQAFNDHKISNEDYFSKLILINELLENQQESYENVQQKIRINVFELEKQFKSAVEKIAKQRNAAAVLYINNVDDTAYVNSDYDITKEVIDMIYGIDSDLVNRISISLTLDSNFLSSFNNNTGKS